MKAYIQAYPFDTGDTMKICKTNALRLWEENYGNARFAEDFHGNLMCRDGYGDEEFCVNHWGELNYCGWNIHHILPLSCGGTYEKHNLICTNIYTNAEAEDKITYWINDCLYQVQRILKCTICGKTPSILIKDYSFSDFSFYIEKPAIT